MDGLSNEAFKGTITSNEVHSDNNTKEVSLSKSGKSSLISRANTEDSRVLYQISCLLDKKKQKNNKVMEYSTMNEEIEIQSCDSEHSEFISFDSSITTRFPKDSMDIKGGDFTLSGPEEGHYMNDSFPLTHRAPRAPPLNKSEERALKRIRRKIKNKLSAQESRRKKKEYVENLEKQVATCTSENSVLNEQVISLNHTVRTLLKEIQRMQESKPKQNKGTQTGICLKCHLMKSAERRRVPESTNNLANIEIARPHQ